MALTIANLEVVVSESRHQKERKKMFSSAATALPFFEH